MKSRVVPIVKDDRDFATACCKQDKHAVVQTASTRLNCQGVASLCEGFWRLRKQELTEHRRIGHCLANAPRLFVLATSHPLASFGSSTPRTSTRLWRTCSINLEAQLDIQLAPVLVLSVYRFLSLSLSLQRCLRWQESCAQDGKSIKTNVKTSAKQNKHHNERMKGIKSDRVWIALS